MKNHGRKMIAPILITAVVIAYFAVYFGFLISRVDKTVLKLLLGILPVLLGGTMIAVCVQRIREINGGEEDDLGQY